MNIFRIVLALVTIFAIVFVFCTTKDDKGSRVVIYNRLGVVGLITLGLVYKFKNIFTTPTVPVHKMTSGLGNIAKDSVGTLYASNLSHASNANASNANASNADASHESPSNASQASNASPSNASNASNASNISNASQNSSRIANPSVASSYILTRTF